MLSMAAAALMLEFMLGYPAWLFRLLKHPVVWIGGLIAVLDRRLNLETLPQRRRRLNGVLALALIVAVPTLPAWLIQRASRRWLPAPLRLAVLACAASTLLAQRSLHDHVAGVAEALRDGGVPSGRAAVSHIVGRDTDRLDASGIVRAAIESLAENFSDGVAAPLFWCALLGLPGIVAYKAVNTADSMIGHQTPRHAAFGWASARLDDWVNLPASRLASLWIVLARPGRLGRSIAIIRRDARRHRSPNAGWPEAAMAGALGIRLAGPRVYGARRVQDAWIGDGEHPAELSDLRRALALYRRACALQLASTFALPLICRSLRHVVRSSPDTARRTRVAPRASARRADPFPADDGSGSARNRSGGASR